MKRPLLTFNDVEEITKILVNNDFEGLYKFCGQYNNIIELLTSFKNTTLDNKESISINVDTTDFKGSVIVDRKDVLNELPEDNVVDIEINGLTIGLGYPSILFSDFTLNKLTCIKYIDSIPLESKDVIKIAENMSISLFKDIEKEIENHIISKLNSLYIFYTKNELYRKKFEFNLDGIIGLFLSICKYEVEYLMKLKLILIKEGNFSYQDFDKMTVEQADIYYKLLKELYKDESD
jgi:hypothetical protein